MIKQQRVQTIDIAKGLGMIFVVMFHAELLDGVWTQFHMPLFALLSGMLYKEKNHSSKQNVVKYILNKVRGLYLPFIGYELAFLSLHNLFYRWNIYSEVHNGIMYSLNDFKNQLVNILTCGGGESLPGPLWYLVAMLEFTVGYTAIRFIVDRIGVQSKGAKNFAVTFVCAMALILGFSTIPFPRMLNSAFVLLFFYHLGWIFHEYGCKKWLNIHYWPVAIVSICTLGVGINAGTCWSQWSWLTIPGALLGIYLTLCISQIIDEKVKSGFKQLIIYIGQHTMFILATHLLWFKIVTFIQIKANAMDVKYLGSYPILKGDLARWKLLYVLCGIGIPILLCWIKERVFKYARENGKR